jgi:uncharacterized membrane protein YcaP (DUF421 family)
MFEMAVPWWELMLRASAVYVFLLVFVRLTGKRQIGQLAPFDLVLLLVLANAVQNSINGGDNSLIGGLVAVLTLILLNHVLGYVTFKSKKLERLIEGRPRILVHNGILYEDVMRKAQLTHHELNSALRQGGCAHAGECRVAILENNGAISIVKKEKTDNEGRTDSRHASKGHGIVGKKPSSSASH